MKPDSLFFRLRGVIALVILLCFVAVFVLSACSAPGAIETEERTTVKVLAAPSTKPALRLLTADLHQRESPLDVEVEYLSAGELQDRIASGHGADVVLTASREQMRVLTDEDRILGDPLPLASNRLVLVTTAENPHSITGFDDFVFRAPALTVATCAADEPCTQQVTDISRTFGLELDPQDATRAGVAPAVGSEDAGGVAVEQAGAEAEPVGFDSEAALSELTEGRSDAALAYVTDVLALDEPLQTFEIPDYQHSTTQVWAGMLSRPADTAAANQLLGVLAGEHTRSAFSEAGFLPPPAADAEASSH